MYSAKRDVLLPSFTKSRWALRWRRGHMTPSSTSATLVHNLNIFVAHYYMLAAHSGLKPQCGDDFHWQVRLTSEWFDVPPQPRDLIVNLGHIGLGTGCIYALLLHACTKQLPQTQLS